MRQSGRLVNPPDLADGSEFELAEEQLREPTNERLFLGWGEKVALVGRAFRQV
jgi:hypothetical protein